MSTNPFIFVEAVSYSKEDLLEDVEQEKFYQPFLVNKSLSYHPDAIFYANDMNYYYNIDKRLQFDYLRHSITRRKRYGKWVKSIPVEYIDVLQKHYTCNKQQAKEIYSLLSEEQLLKIKSLYNEKL